MRAPNLPGPGWTMPGQLWRQLPQFWGSAVGSTHAAVQRMYGLRQVNPHCMLLQTGMAFVGVGQTLPQVPQFEVLVSRSTHDPLQFVVAPPQTVVQAPPLHTCAVHIVGQAPQWLLSDLRSTHAPPQFVYPKLQAIPQPDALHTALPLGTLGQILPQVPQFCVSASSLTQTPLHRLYPASHLRPKRRLRTSPRRLP